MSLFRLSGVSLNLAANCCFTDFSTQVEWGQKIALVGANGSGKSSLLKFLARLASPCEGQLIADYDYGCAYLQQHEAETQLSGGEYIVQQVQQALRQQADLLLLDEPTNHLDTENKAALLRQLQHYHGSLIIVSHELDWLEACCDTFWIIEQQQIQVFHGRYRDWLAEREQQAQQLQAQRQQLKRQQTAQHQRLMHEQERAAHARQRGIQAIQERRWATIRSASKLARGCTTAVDQRASITQKSQDLAQQLAQLRPDNKLQPEFFLPASYRKSDKPLVQLNAVEFGYRHALSPPLTLQLFAGQRCLLSGRNGSGKSCLLKALRDQNNQSNLRKSGTWFTPAPEQIAYLDQHHHDLPATLCVLDYFASQTPAWSLTQQRQHLARFLLRGALCERPCKQLSGGEQMRLRLALIAAQVPQLLILDEPVNHLDYKARSHLLEVLKQYPGSYILVCHDQNLLQALEFDLHISW